jgi:hypothetical protein
VTREVVIEEDRAYPVDGHHGKLGGIEAEEPDLARFLPEIKVGARLIGSRRSNETVGCSAGSGGICDGPQALVITGVPAP